ncbi:MAG: group 1 truncated hemoglobin [Caulobacteraceae bacterium]
MNRFALIAAVTLLAAGPGRAAEPAPTGDAGATPFANAAVFKAFHGQAGLDRIVDAFVARNTSDPRIADIFATQDLVAFRARLKEHFCYVLGGGCHYTGKDMTTAHKDMGIQTANFNAVVENLQWAMDKEGVAFGAQNRFLAKLAPLKHQIVTR